MALRLAGYIDLPAHQGKGGFDHAAIHHVSGRLFVAHTANDAMDIIDSRTDQYLESITGLVEVAGALVSDGHGLAFTSNRGENTVSIFPPMRPAEMVRIPVGVRPNGLAYDPTYRLLLAANVGDPAVPGSHTVSMVDVSGRRMVANVPVSGRTRWAVFDPGTGWFYVNISTPPLVAVIDPSDPTRVARTLEIPVEGPHGLDGDASGGRLFCACDGGELVTPEATTGRVLNRLPISGVPDVVCFHPARQRLYIAVGDPGVIDVIDTAAMARVETVSSERGGKTMALDAAHDKLYVFLPESHRAAVFVDA
jgi:DNA-binding beta-propeller fold protein YncE